MDNAESSLKIRQTVETTARDLQHDRILQWLRAPDPSSNHNAARDRHEPATGQWLLKSHYFDSWIKSDKQLLWLHGLPGAGKTILTSTVIEEVRARYLSEGAFNYAYYYFDFTDEKKQTTAGFLRSTLVQLSRRDTRCFGIIKELYDANDCGKDEPSEKSLMSALLRILESPQKIYLIVDALDECTHREILLNVLSQIFNKSLAVNIFVMSRDEADLESTLNSLATSKIAIQNALVDDDIKLYLQSQLLADSQLKKFPASVKDRIKKLADSADGM